MYYITNLYFTCKRSIIWCNMLIFSSVYYLIYLNIFHIKQRRRLFIVELFTYNFIKICLEFISDKLIHTFLYRLPCF